MNGLIIDEKQECDVGTLKPKAAIPLKRIISVGLVSDEDKKKFKKLDKASDIIFKVRHSSFK